MKPNTKRILFITQWQFDDALIQTYTLPYVYIIQKITSCYPYVITTDNSLDKVQIRKRQGVISIGMPSSKKLLLLGWLLNIARLQNIIRKKRIQVIHPWCTPAGAVGAVLKGMDKNLILNIDSFEPHAEPMVENKTWKKYGLKYNILFHYEKVEARIANHLILAAPGMENYIKEKYDITISNYFTKPACTDLTAFSSSYSKNKELLHKYNLEDKIVGVYAGKFGGIYLEDETFELVRKCIDYWGKAKFRFLLLSNVSDAYLYNEMDKYGIEHSCCIKLFVNHNDIPNYIGLADFAFSPYKPIPSKRYCTPIKNGEYWAMGLPAIITPNISIDSELIEKNNAGALLTSFDEEGYLSAITKIDKIIKGKSREEIYTQIRPLAEKYRNFSIAEKVYQALYG